jgi:hypothetical protein
VAGFGLALVFVSIGQGAEDKLATRAKGYADKTLEEFHIDPTDGIDLAEAKLIADWVVLGTVDLKDNRARITGYSEPVTDGLFWRIDVTQNESVPEGARRGPLFIGKLSGRNFGRGWINGGGPSVDLGKAAFYIDDWSGPAKVWVRLKRLVRPNDAAARMDIEVCANQVANLFNAKPDGYVVRIERGDIKISEAPVTDQFDGPDRQWIAQIALRLKQRAP